MKRIFEEIKERRLWQTLIVYCGGGFGLMQVVDILLNRLGLPASYFTIFLVFLVAGVPGSLIVAWFHGKEGAQRIRKTEVILQLVLLLAALGVSYHFTTAGNFLLHEGPLDDRSIAVLPFVDLSPNKDQEYFSDGLSEELLNLLSRNTGLKVICRTSSFSFKGKNEDVRTISAILGVANIVEGSVQKSGDKLRISVQLIDARDGTNRWSQTFDREMKSIFALEDEIAQTVVGELKATVSLDRQASGSPERNTEAYNLFLLGRYFHQLGGRENIAKSIETLKRALRIDSTDAQAWTELAAAYSSQSDYGYIGTAEGYALAREAVRKAVLLDNTLAVAHGELAWISMAYDWDWPAAETEFRTALSLEPGNVELIRNSATLSAILGKRNDAIGLFRESVSLDPVKFGSQVSFLFYAYQLLSAEKFEDARAECAKALRADSQAVLLHLFSGFAALLEQRFEVAGSDIRMEVDSSYRLWGTILYHTAVGRRDSAESELERFISLYQNEDAYQICEVYAYRGEIGEAFRWMERAYLQRDGGLLLVKSDPFLAKLRSDPRYVLFLRKMNLPV
ncbi:MAG TPA: hypothetical protein VMG34_01995 [Bacteroidota bacterium]|nr:hypothetical protein [Bacteroidota bacterium]